jgi:High potential iron-sulfur protein
MSQRIDESRRQLLRKLTLGVVLLPVAGKPLVALAADMPLLTTNDPVAKALQYVDDASKAPGAKPGSKCANCKNYQGAANSTQGGCLIFPGKSVKASGWCLSWVAKS